MASLAPHIELLGKFDARSRMQMINDKMAGGPTVLTQMLIKLSLVYRRVAARDEEGMAEAMRVVAAAVEAAKAEGSPQLTPSDQLVMLFAELFHSMHTSELVPFEPERPPVAESSQLQQLQPMQPGGSRANAGSLEHPIMLDDGEEGREEKQAEAKEQAVQTDEGVLEEEEGGGGEKKKVIIDLCSSSSSEDEEEEEEEEAADEVPNVQRKELIGGEEKIVDAQKDVDEEVEKMPAETEDGAAAADAPAEQQQQPLQLLEEEEAEPAAAAAASKTEKTRLSLSKKLSDLLRIDMVEGNDALLAAANTEDDDEAAMTSGRPSRSCTKRARASTEEPKETAVAAAATPTTTAAARRKRGAAAAFEAGSAAKMGRREGAAGEQPITPRSQTRHRSGRVSATTTPSARFKPDPSHAGRGGGTRWGCGGMTCTRAFESKEDVFQHMLREHMLEGEVHGKCIDCGETADSFAALAVHRKQQPECSSENSYLSYWTTGIVKWPKRAGHEEEPEDPELEREKTQLMKELDEQLHRCNEKECEGKPFGTFDELIVHQKREHKCTMTYACSNRSCGRVLHTPFHFMQHVPPHCHGSIPKITAVPCKKRRWQQLAEEEKENVEEECTL